MSRVPNINVDIVQSVNTKKLVVKVEMKYRFFSCLQKKKCQREGKLAHL